MLVCTWRRTYRSHPHHRRQSRTTPGSSSSRKYDVSCEPRRSLEIGIRDESKSDDVTAVLLLIASGVAAGRDREMS